MTDLDIMLDELRKLWAEVSVIIAGPHTRLWPIYLVAMVLTCYLIYRYRRIDQPFLAWLLPKSVYCHPSHIVDLKVFCVNRIFSGLGIFSLVFFSSSVADIMASKLGLGLEADPLHPILTALLLLMVTDFGTYWTHRIHHESRILWPFHSLHHSAEVMTPFTVYRKHPIYDLLSTFVKGVLIGTLQGIFLVLFAQKPSYLTIMGVTGGYFLFNLIGANLRHTHIWLSYGRLLEHIFVSPAQHQIHHSLDPKHHNKNYGGVLAIWDWMFGTLYVPRTHETLEFGLADSKGNRLCQRHVNLAKSMFLPVRDSWRQAVRLLGLQQSNQPPEPESRPQDTTLTER